MNLLMIIGTYLGLALIGVVSARVLSYHRPHLSGNASFLFNWLILFLMVLGIPWLILFKLIRQENWVNQLLLYFQLQRLPVYSPDTVQELFNRWTEQHRLDNQEPPKAQRDGFHRVVAEDVRWLSTRQVLSGYAYAKPISATERQTGITYLQTNHLDTFSYAFSGRVCLVRTGQAAYGVYSESYEMY
jgi:hypothetical protein